MDQFHHGDYVVGRPSGWLDASNVILVGPPSPTGYSPSLVITREDFTSPMKADEYAQRQLESLRASLSDQNYRVVVEGPLTLNGQLAYQRIHAFTPPNLQSEITQIQVYVIHKKQAFTLTASDKTQTFDQNRSLLQRAIGCFQLV